MRLNNFNENPSTASKSHPDNLKQPCVKPVPKFILEMAKNPSTRPRISFTKPKIYQHKILSNSVPLLSQTVQKTPDSFLEVLGIILMKIMAHQLVDNGYSILKFNILKTIRDIENESIFHKYHLLYNFKTSPKELLLILNSSLKLIQNSIHNHHLSHKYLHNSKNSDEYRQDCITLHDIVIEHMQKFHISLQFFTILIKMVLMLVHYPKLDSLMANLPPKEIYFIVCDYLDCHIEENTHGYLLEKRHFIKQMRYHFQFGLLINCPIKSTIKSQSKLLFFSDQKTAASKSTQNLFLNSNDFTPSLNRSRSQRHTEILNQKGFAQNFEMKGSFLFLDFDRHKQIQQCESVFELACDTSIFTDKENVEMSNLSGLEGSSKNFSKVKKRGSLQSNEDKKGKNNEMKGVRKSFNVQQISRGERKRAKCFRCSHRREMEVESNVVRVQI